MEANTAYFDRVDVNIKTEKKWNHRQARQLNKCPAKISGNAGDTMLSIVSISPQGMSMHHILGGFRQLWRALNAMMKC